MPLLQAALNGDRQHPAVPRTPYELAAEARAAVDAGARVLHLHPYDREGRETFDAEPCAEALDAVRAVCPGIPISLSTSADIEPDPEKRHALVAAWTDLPELVTANQGEEGIVELCELLIERGIGIEAGLLSLDDAHALFTSFHTMVSADPCVTRIGARDGVAPGELSAKKMSHPATFHGCDWRKRSRSTSAAGRSTANWGRVPRQPAAILRAMGTDRGSMTSSSRRPSSA